MFSFFKKRREYPSDSRWSALTGQRDGKPLVIRRNDSASTLAEHPEYKYRVGVAIPLNQPNEQGLPSNEEMNQLNEIEDVLVERLESGQDGLQVLAITTGGMREFVFYTRNPVAVRTAIEQIRQTTTSHEIQSYISEDRKWDVYRDFAESRWH